MTTDIISSVGQEDAGESRDLCNNHAMNGRVLIFKKTKCERLLKEFGTSNKDRIN